MLVLISIVGLIIFIIGYGGVDAVLSEINQIRSGKVERNTIAAIARMFTSYSVVALLISFIKLYTTKSNNTKIYGFLLFMSSTVITLISSIMSGGRGRLIIPFLLLYLAKVVIDKKWNIGKMIILGTIACFVILFGPTILQNISYGLEYIIDSIDMSNADALIKKIIGEFTHPFYSLLVAMEVTEDESKLLLFRNPIYTILFFGNLFGFDYNGTISHYNTQYILGDFDSNIPPGVVASGYYDLYFLGVIITGILFGCFIGYTQAFYNMIFKNNEYSEINLALYLILANSIAQFVFNGDIRVTIMGNFSTMILFLMLYILNSKIIIRKRFFNSVK
ncbi:O-antigen polymerase [Sporomusa sphaeroides]|uniref:O-antigen polymerase n=1 Tax=Sporomusa sphaeroides TaxID=47679 RepID=UPI002C0E5853|nr:O-antigen polymerase [Sporomusa sphaeroides]HML34172.1 O-antigen polymerase [Sporomusa sphaeroides]